MIKLYIKALSLHDDWWEVFWKNYLTDPQHFMEESFRVLDEANRAHMEITGKGLWQGPKL